MTTSTALPNSLAAGKLSRWFPWALGAGVVAITFGAFGVTSAITGTQMHPVGAAVTALVAYALLLWLISLLVEGRRRATDRFVTIMVTTAFALALIPLISVIWTVVERGAARFDPQFFTYSMYNVLGEGGGAIHAIIGTLLVTLFATIISVPVGLLTSIYLVEYGRGRLAKAITFLVDVMTGIPSIVAGLFAYALFAMLFGPGTKMGFAGSVALSVLMIPVIVRSSEEMLRLVPNELREASFALGVPKWLTILKVVIPNSIAGIATGVTLAIARVIGETAPLLVVAGLTASVNYNVFSGWMTTLPVFVYTQFSDGAGTAGPNFDRAWAGALTLILIVMALNLLARLIAKIFSPKLR